MDKEYKATSLEIPELSELLTAEKTHAEIENKINFDNKLV
jgi:hypothetical protein